MQFTFTVTLSQKERRILLNSLDMMQNDLYRINYTEDNIGKAMNAIEEINIMKEKLFFEVRRYE